MKEKNQSQEALGVDQRPYREKKKGPMNEAVADYISGFLLHVHVIKNTCMLKCRFLEENEFYRGKDETTKIYQGWGVPG